MYSTEWIDTHRQRRQTIGRILSALVAAAIIVGLILFLRWTAQGTGPDSGPPAKNPVVQYEQGR